jgi:hypothetical protein
VGARNPDHRARPVVDVPGSHTLAEMHLRGLEVHARCERCRTRLKVDLPALIRVLGPDASLWRRRPPCRVVGCEGRAVFLARASPGARFVRLG